MDWTIITDIALGAAALSVARDARQTANRIATVLSALTDRVDTHDARITRLEQAKEE